MKSKVWCCVSGFLLCGQVAWGADRVKLEMVGEIEMENAIRDIEPAGSNLVLLTSTASQRLSKTDR